MNEETGEKEDTKESVDGFSLEQIRAYSQLGAAQEGPFSKRRGLNALGMTAEWDLKQQKEREKLEALMPDGVAKNRFTEISTRFLEKRREAIARHERNEIEALKSNMEITMLSDVARQMVELKQAQHAARTYEYEEQMKRQQEDFSSRQQELFTKWCAKTGAEQGTTMQNFYDWCLDKDNLDSAWSKELSDIMEKNNLAAKLAKEAYDRYDETTWSDLSDMTKEVWDKIYDARLKDGYDAKTAAAMAMAKAGDTAKGVVENLMMCGQLETADRLLNKMENRYATAAVEERKMADGSTKAVINPDEINLNGALYMTPEQIFDLRTRLTAQEKQESAKLKLMQDRAAAQAEMGMSNAAVWAMNLVENGAPYTVEQIKEALYSGRGLPQGCMGFKEAMGLSKETANKMKTLFSRLEEINKAKTKAEGDAAKALRGMSSDDWIERKIGEIEDEAKYGENKGQAKITTARGSEIWMDAREAKITYINAYLNSGRGTESKRKQMAALRDALTKQACERRQEALNRNIADMLKMRAHKAYRKTAQMAKTEYEEAPAYAKIGGDGTSVSLGLDGERDYVTLEYGGKEYNVRPAAVEAVLSNVSNWMAQDINLSDAEVVEYLSAQMDKAMANVVKASFLKNATSIDNAKVNPRMEWAMRTASTADLRNARQQGEVTMTELMAAGIADELDETAKLMEAEEDMNAKHGQSARSLSQLIYNSITAKEKEQDFIGLITEEE